jgi:hypothetical protein
MSCVSFTGSQRNVAGDASNTQSASLAINTTSDGATVANFAIDGNTPTVSQTKIWAESPNNPGGGGSYAIGGSGTTTHTFTSSTGTRRSIVGVQLTALGGGAAFNDAWDVKTPVSVSKPSAVASGMTPSDLINR